MSTGSTKLYCYICKLSGEKKPIADLHWHGLGVHPECLVAIGDEIARSRAALQWRSMRDDFPKVEGYYLCVLPAQDDEPMPVVDFCSADGGFSDPYLTHWREVGPLPSDEPPKEQP